jgi:hypothetical protein
METKDIIKKITTFTPDIFKQRHKMSESYYYHRLGKEAVSGGIIKQEELDTFTTQLKGHKMKIANSVVTLENLIKLKLRQMIDKYYFDNKNKIDSEDKFVDEIININKKQNGRPRNRNKTKEI